MKILAIRLANLNSLLGTWAIDFTAPEYGAAGLFAITGPTGAGKSTILDALCLALFGRTPRLGPISKGSNEILSRRAGHCFAECEFETARGHFRCHWGQHRTRRSPGGELQTPKHEIVDAASGRILESRSREVVRRVEEVTGMDYDRFTRSILLAQGGFAAFLEAEADQRAPILEQITGTGIYSRISIAVHERTSEERRLTGQLRQELAGISLLGAAELKELTARISAAEAEAVALQQRLTLADQELQRLDRIEGLQAQLRSTEAAQQALAARRGLAEADLQRYQRGLRAQGFAAEAARLAQLGERWAALQAQAEQLGPAIQAQEQAHRQAAADHARAGERLQAGEATLTRESELIKTVRGLDVQLQEKHRVLGQAEAALGASAAEQERLRREQAESELQLAAADQRLAQLAEYFRCHSPDGLLVEQLTGIREQLLLLHQRESALVELEQALGQRQAERSRAEAQGRELQQAAQQAGEELALIGDRQQALAAERQTLLNGQEPAVLRTRLEQAEERLRGLAQVGELLARQQRAVAERQTLEAARSELTVRRQQAQLRLQALEEQLRLSEQLVRQQEQLHRQSLRIHSYETERRRLRAGEHCPLCGATHHPWAEGGPLPADAEAELVRLEDELARLQGEVGEVRAQLIGLDRDLAHTGLAERRALAEQAEAEQRLAPLLPLVAGAADPAAAAAHQFGLGRQQADALRQRLHGLDQVEERLQAVRSQADAAGDRCRQLQGWLQAALHEAEGLDKEISRLDREAAARQAAIASGRAALLDRLQPFAIEACPPHQAEALLGRLEERLRAWKTHQERYEQARQQRAELQAGLERLTLLRANLEAGRAQQQAERDRLAHEQQALRSRRQSLYGDRDPEIEEQRLKGLVSAAQAEEAATRVRVTALERDLHSQHEQLARASEESARLGLQLSELEAALLARLPAAGLLDLADLHAALLPPESLAALAALKEQLDREAALLAGRGAEQQAALAREQELHQGRPGREALQAEQQEAGRELSALQQRTGADRQRLAVDQQQQQRFARQQETLAARERELARWELLHQLIGSADGKRFRVFAQGLTFELVISHANRQLARMSDRYILLPDPAEPLALQVIDNYQAGEVRSTRNLSGGESFLVSLALALGLSAMASRTVRVDSLFLDEGFGTLDEESLDIALQTLAELHQDGKLIGIISHVGQLKERVDVRIQVVPGPGGNSRLLGPGCARLP